MKLIDKFVAYVEVKNNRHKLIKNLEKFAIIGSGIVTIILIFGILSK